jgi:hypothetical protein
MYLVLCRTSLLDLNAVVQSATGSPWFPAFMFVCVLLESVFPQDQEGVLQQAVRWRRPGTAKSRAFESGAEAPDKDWKHRPRLGALTTPSGKEIVYA